MTSVLASRGPGHPNTLDKDSRKYMSSNHAPNGQVGHEKYSQSIVTPPSSSFASSFSKQPPSQQSASGHIPNPFPTPTSSAAGTVPSTSALDFDQDTEMAQPLDPDVVMGNSGLEDGFGGKRKADFGVDGFQDAASPGKRVKLGKEGQPVPSIQELLEQSDVGPLYLVGSRRGFPDPNSPRWISKSILLAG